MVAAGQAAVVAADAGPDVLGTPFLGLERPLRVGPERPPQADEVTLALFQDALGKRGQVDGARRDHRDRHRLLRRFGAPDVVGQRHAHGAHFVDGGVVDAARHVDGSHAPDLEPLGQFHGLLDAVAVGLVVGAAEPADHREIRAHLGLDLLDDLHAAGGCGSRTTPPYQSVRLLEYWRQEVGDEIAVAGVDLHQVEPGRSARRLAARPKALMTSRISSMVIGMGMGQPMAVISGQGTSDAAFGCSRMNRCRPACEIWMPATAPWALMVSHRSDRPGRWSIREIPSWQGEARLYRSSTQAYSTTTMRHAALRHLFVVAEQALGDGAVGIGQAGVLRGLDDAVLERDIGDAARLEQTGESVSHQHVPSIGASGQL